MYQILHNRVNKKVLDMNFAAEFDDKLCLL